MNSPYSPHRDFSLGPVAKFTLLLTLPLSVLSIGAYKLTMAVAVASESIKYLPSNLVYAPDILTSLAILIGSVILSTGLARVMFSFSRYMEVRVGYTQLVTQNAEGDSIRPVPELPKPVVVRNLDKPTRERLSEPERDADTISRDRHETASAHTRLASFRANAKQSVGHSELRDSVSLQSKDELVQPRIGGSELFPVRERRVYFEDE